MSDNPQRYELFVKSIAGFMSVSLTATHWSWSRLSRNGSILVRGGDYGSLEACFASARRHRAQYGQAPITINLQKVPEKRVPITPETRAVECDALITNFALDRAGREERRAQALIVAPPEPSETIAPDQNLPPSAEAA